MGLPMKCVSAMPLKRGCEGSAGTASTRLPSAVSTPPKGRARAGCPPMSRAALSRRLPPWLTHVSRLVLLAFI